MESERDGEIKRENMMGEGRAGKKLDAKQLLQ